MRFVKSTRFCGMRRKYLAPAPPVDFSPVSRFLSRMTKRIAFLSRSHLSQNLLRLVLATLSQKTEYHAFGDLLDAHNKSHGKGASPKPFTLMVIDLNAVHDIPKMNVQNLLSQRLFRDAKKILVHMRDADIAPQEWMSFGFDGFLTKPFLPQEFLALVTKKAGGKS